MSLEDLILKNAVCPNIFDSNQIDFSNLITGLGYDSFALISLIIDIEKLYNITFEDNDLILEKLNSIEDLR